MDTAFANVTETHTTYLEYVDATVQIDNEGNARLVLKSPGADDNIILDPDELAAIIALWERATWLE